MIPTILPIGKQTFIDDVKIFYFILKGELNPYYEPLMIIGGLTRL